MLSAANFAFFGGGGSGNFCTGNFLKRLFVNPIDEKVGGLFFREMEKQKMEIPLPFQALNCSGQIGCK